MPVIANAILKLSKLDLKLAVGLGKDRSTIRANLG